MLEGLDINAGLDNAGFTLHKVLSKLIIKNLFAELKLTDISAWNPFNSPFSLELTALRIIVEDAYSPADRKVWLFFFLSTGCLMAFRSSGDLLALLTLPVTQT